MVVAVVDMNGEAKRAEEDAKADATRVEHVFEFNTVASALISGALAGAIAKTAIAPLDRTKIYFQVSSTERYSMRAAVAFISNTYRTDGFFALYRGNSAMMARVMPFAAIQFAAYEQFKLILHVDENGKSTPVRRFLSGTLAAMMSTCLTYPLDTARARFATNPNYRTLRSVFSSEYATSGVFGFYRGVLPTLYGMVPYAGTSFFTISTLKLYYKERTGKTSGPLTNFLFGAIAGVVGQTTSYPLDIVRRRMQTGNLPVEMGVPRALLNIAHTEGVIGGLYKGLSMNWIKGPISTGIVFTVYDLIYDNVKLLSKRRSVPPTQT